MQPSSFKHVLPRGLELFLKAITLECQEYLSTGTRTMDVENHEQVSYFPHSLNSKRLWRSQDTGSERCPLTQSRRVNVWHRIERCVCHYEHQLLLGAVHPLRVWTSHGSPAERALPPPHKRGCEAMQSWDLNTGRQAAKPIPVNSFLSAGLRIKKEKKKKKP